MLNDIDADALARAMDRARRDPRLAAQLDEMLKARPWQEVAKFAAYNVQAAVLSFGPVNLRRAVFMKIAKPANATSTRNTCCDDCSLRASRDGSLR